MSTPAREPQPFGVLLFNRGGPEDQAAVEPFLVNLFSDREVIELPFGARVQPLMARLIARRHGPSVRRNYARIGGGSPQRRLTEEQARALEGRLQTRLARSGASTPRVRVVIAMRYGRPGTAEALAALADEGIRRAVTLPLYPHYSRATTGSSERELARELARARWRPHGFEVTSIDRWPDHPLYLDALADTVRRAYEAFTEPARRRLVILFSAHGLPQKLIDAGDPYVEQIEATRRGLLERLALPNRQVLGYQSRTGPVRWIGPGTDQRIDELAREGVRELLVVPLSFVGDHIGTLYEVDLRLAEQARAKGILEYRRCEALHTHPRFIEALADLVESHLLRAAEAAP